MTSSFSEPRGSKVSPGWRTELAYALAQPDLVGVWGGTTERERRKIRRQVA